MAFAHIIFNDGTKYGGMLRKLLNQIEQGDELFVDVRDVMIQMRDGDGSQASHYAEVTKQFGFGGFEPTGDYGSGVGVPSAAQNALAKSAFDELDSAFSKTSGNGSVSNVRAARDQFIAKLR